MWYRIDVHYACAGVQVKYGVVVKAAPIHNWMRGKPLPDIERWVAHKGGTITPLTT
jgi:hypothetical protein